MAEFLLLEKEIHGSIDCGCQQYFCSLGNTVLKPYSSNILTLLSVCQS